MIKPSKLSKLWALTRKMMLNLFTHNKSMMMKWLFLLYKIHQVKPVNRDQTLILFPYFQHKKYKISTKHLLNLMCKFRYYPLNMLTPSKPIAYLDTGAQRTMMDLDILPIEAYKRSFYFITTNCKVFKIEWVTKTPIGIRFFTKCIV